MEKELNFNQETQEDVFAVEDPEMEVYTQNDSNEEEEVYNPAGVLRFVNPLTIDGKEIKEVKYDFSKIKPIQYINICQAVGKKENVLLPAYNLSIQANMFCKAADIPPAIIKTQMSVPDFTVACDLARDFLLSGNRVTAKEDMIL